MIHVTSIYAGETIPAREKRFEKFFPKWELSETAFYIVQNDNRIILRLENVNNLRMRLYFRGYKTGVEFGVHHFSY